MLVREDLKPGQPAVQAAHAAIEVARAFILPDAVHPHLVICGVPDEIDLLLQQSRLHEAGIRFKPFYDYGECTAIATEPLYDSNRRLFKACRLLGT